MLALGPDLFGTRWLALGPLRYDNLYPLILVLTGANFFEALLLTFFLDEHNQVLGVQVSVYLKGTILEKCFE